MARMIAGSSSDPSPVPSTRAMSVFVPAKWALMAASSRRTCSRAENSRLVLMSIWMREAKTAHAAISSAAPANTRRFPRPLAARAEARRKASSQGCAAASRSRSRRRGVGSMARTAGMMVSSITSAERMPKPVKSPKVRMVAVRKVTSEQNESAAIVPAAIMTGPTRASDSAIAASTSCVRSNSS